MIYYQIKISVERVGATAVGDTEEVISGPEILHSSEDRTVVQGVYSKIVSLVNALIKVGFQS
jgi:hypothetical protein